MTAETKELRLVVVLLLAGMIGVGAWATYVNHITGLKVIEQDAVLIEEIRDLRMHLKSTVCGTDL